MTPECLHQSIHECFSESCSRVVHQGHEITILAQSMWRQYEAMSNQLEHALKLAEEVRIFIENHDQPDSSDATFALLKIRLKQLDGCPQWTPPDEGDHEGTE